MTEVCAFKNAAKLLLVMSIIQRSLLDAAVGSETNIKNVEEQQSCINVANAMAFARLEIQQKTLSELEQRVQQKTSELQSKRLQFQETVDRYDSIVRNVDQILIDIYSKMKPELAALQLANLDDDSAAGLLLKLKPKSAGAILGEMDAFHAALLAKKIAEFSSVRPGAKKP